MNLNAIEELLKSNAKWLKDLSRDDCAEARKGIAAGRPTPPRRSLSFSSSLPTTPTPTATRGIATTTRRSTTITSKWRTRSANDDADFDEAQETFWGDPFQMGWFRSVCEAFAGMTETAV